VRRGILVALLLAGLAAVASGGDAPAAPPEPPAGSATAIFAGGCFWCMEAPFDALDGVISTTVGYTGGHTDAPSYEQVSSGSTGHAEAVRVVYDPKKLSYQKLLEVFWHNVDPLDAGGQFCDRGTQYRSAIFATNAEQRRLAEASKRELAASGRLQGKIVTEIVPAGPFYPAEEYHQDYYRKNPIRYRFYRRGCGRDHRLEQLWKDAAGH
jgi:peptide-methionine (S)-S-oxide reductase